ncbi:hypothetical protein ACFOZ0_27630 [Streptomyces yaanensis]|uniref:DUF11 domain-containing protein n=1 Tax=Streptomyces yaanensis TaxID=1142239 RepID=A0ABV7SKW7_9ACTN|nr:hypothetical protein [Streptomyces sp. CGMCC 4.7035]WNB97009.1 hypothetical protein Q2K21_02385 [Streptomyces sp. CGMCC 4.7035]
MRKRMRMAVVLGAAAVVGVAVPAVAASPEADLSYHGYVAMAADEVGVWLTPRNHGPADVAGATVQVRWSLPLADQQVLPAGCVRSDARTVLCGTGPIGVGRMGKEIDLRVRLGVPSTEVTMTIDTLWVGGTVDPNHGNDQRQVLVLDTGDVYAF